MADNDKQDMWEKETAQENVIFCHYQILWLSGMHHQYGRQDGKFLGIIRYPVHTGYCLWYVWLGCSQITQDIFIFSFIFIKTK